MSAKTPARKASRTIMVRLADLVEDLSVYPRSRVSNNNVRNIALALESGHRLPPIIACEDTFRIVDGFHRRRAFLRVHHDPDYAVKVELRHYDTEADLLADAVRCNVGRGLDLGEYEKRKVVLRLGEMGVDDDAIAMILRVPEPRIRQIKVRIVTVTHRGKPLRVEALKPSLAHFTGQTMTERQAKAARLAPGVNYGFLVRQLTSALHDDLLNSSDGRLVAALEALAEAITDYLG